MDAAPLVASARMYAVASGATAAWARLFAHVAERSGVELTVIEHAYPAPLPALWSRPDLGCAFMCGWPFALEDRAGGFSRPLIAAPIPDADWSAGAAIYRSEFVVARDAPFACLEDTFGHRFAYDAMSSHSGVNMPRTHLSRWSDRAPLFRNCIGPLTTPRRCIAAVMTGSADVTAVDSYALQLMRRHDADIAHRIRVIGATEPSPIPPLVGGPALTDAHRLRLRDALIALRTHTIGRALLDELCLSGFAPVDRAIYCATLSVEDIATSRGYPQLV